MVFKLGMAADVCMACMLILVSMTLTLMQGHSGSAKAKHQGWIISTTKQAPWPRVVNFWFLFWGAFHESSECYVYLITSEANRLWLGKGLQQQSPLPADPFRSLTKEQARRTQSGYMLLGSLWGSVGEGKKLITLQQKWLDPDSLWRSSLWWGYDQRRQRLNY